MNQDKGLVSALGVVEGWAIGVVDVIVSTILLPLNFLMALLNFQTS